MSTNEGIIDFTKGNSERLQLQVKSIKTGAVRKTWKHFYGEIHRILGLVDCISP